MNDSDDMRQDFLALRDSTNAALIATLGPDGAPEASYAPLVWSECAAYLFLSELASHTRNLKQNPDISLLLLEPDARVRNPFARRRITLQGSARPVARDADSFATVLAEFHRCFGDVMDIIEPLPDFQLFRVAPNSGRFIRGFGQAFELTGENLDRLAPVDPRA